MSSSDKNIPNQIFDSDNIKVFIAMLIIVMQNIGTYSKQLTGNEFLIRIAKYKNCRSFKDFNICQKKANKKDKNMKIGFEHPKSFNRKQ